MCVHWYGTEAEDFVSYVTEWHDMYDKDIFITEFAPEVCAYNFVSFCVSAY